MATKKKTEKQTPEPWTNTAYLNAAAMRLQTTPATFRSHRIDRANNLVIVITEAGEKHIFSFKSLEKTP